MALIKFGYPMGTFITNARITPQGKREFLDSYPDLELEFVDGDTLAEEVLDNPLLKAVWFDGQSITRVNNAVIIPTLVRLHEGDIPVHPLRYFTECNPSDLITFLQNRHPHLKFSVRSGMVRPDVFNAYRPPEVASIEEGISAFLTVMEIVCEGHALLEEIPTLARDTCRATSGWICKKLTGVTVKAGEPYLGSPQRSSKEPHVVTGIKVGAVIQTCHSAGDEDQWFSAIPLEGWSDDTDARVTESDWIRLYCVDADFCVSYEIDSATSSNMEAYQRTLREITRAGWKKSVFCLHPPWESWADAVPPPDETVPWPYDGRTLCGWFHWTLLGGPVLIPSATEEPVLQGPSEEDEATRLGLIREYIANSAGVEPITPERARHMVALVGDDPLAEWEFVRYRTAEVTAFPENLPSPIQPRSRRFSFCIAWKADCDVKRLENVLRSRQKLLMPFRQATAEIEVFKSFVALTVEFVPEGIEDKPTRELLREARVVIERSIAAVEAGIEGEAEAQGRRATREYWECKYGVRLASSWRDSSKTYVWRQNSVGELVHVDAAQFLRDTVVDEGGAK